jgi:hypothetical protein
VWCRGVVGRTGTAGQRSFRTERRSFWRSLGSKARGVVLHTVATGLEAPLTSALQRLIIWGRFADVDGLHKIAGETTSLVLSTTHRFHGGLQGEVVVPLPITDKTWLGASTRT